MRACHASPNNRHWHLAAPGINLNNAIVRHLLYRESENLSSLRMTFAAALLARAAPAMAYADPECDGTIEPFMGTPAR